MNLSNYEMMNLSKAVLSHCSPGKDESPIPPGQWRKKLKKPITCTAYSGSALG
jgi:hypothetical protein